MRVGSDTPWRRYPSRAPCRYLYVEWLLATICPFRPSSCVPSRCFLFLVADNVELVPVVEVVQGAGSDSDGL
jgi:hypothetical protein